MGEFAVYDVFNPLDYLQSYYGELKSEAEGLLQFLVDAFATLPQDVSVLEFGAGPTIIGLIPAAHKAKSIHFCDYVESNRNVVNRWLSGDEHDFDWTPFIMRALQMEGIANPTPEQIAERSERIRDIVTKVSSCDIYQTPPVDTTQKFDVIITNYCLDAVTGDKTEWQAHIRNLKTLLKSNGMFVMSSLQEAQYSDFGDTRFPNVYLVEDDIPEALRLAGFSADSIRVVSAPADHDQREYRGVIFASAIEL